MEASDKFGIFIKLCVLIFLTLIILKFTCVITISFWLVFLPIIIPLIIILKELGAFN